MDPLSRKAFHGWSRTIVGQHQSYGEGDLTPELLADHHVSDIDHYDIRLRDRWLRTLSREDSDRIVSSTAINIRRMLDRHRPNLVIGIDVDNHVLHQLVGELRSRSIPFIGLMACYVDGYVRVSVQGAYQEIRSVSPEEVGQLRRSLLADEYAPPYANKSKLLWASGALRSYLAHRRRSTVHRVKRAFEPAAESWRYYDHSWRCTAQVRKMPDLCYPIFEHRGWRRRCVTGRPCIFLPLQFTPEATVDYWVPLDCVDIEAAAEQIVASLATRATVFVKEHPAMRGRRSLDFYRRLRMHSHVCVVPAEVPAREVIPMADVVVTWSGSVGIEAMLAGKPVVTLGRPYYEISQGMEVAERLNLVPPAIAKALKARRFGENGLEEQQTELLTRLLTGAIPGRFLLGNYGHPSNVELLAQGLRDHVIPR